MNTKTTYRNEMKNLLNNYLNYLRLDLEERVGDPFIDMIDFVDSTPKKNLRDLFGTIVNVYSEKFKEYETKYVNKASFDKEAWDEIQISDNNLDTIEHIYDYVLGQLEEQGINISKLPNSLKETLN